MAFKFQIECSAAHSFFPKGARCTINSNWMFDFKKTFNFHIFSVQYTLFITLPWHKFNTSSGWFANILRLNQLKKNSFKLGRYRCQISWTEANKVSRLKWPYQKIYLSKFITHMIFSDLKNRLVVILMISQKICVEKWWCTQKSEMGMTIDLNTKYQKLLKT